MLANLSKEIDSRLTEIGVCSLPDLNGLLHKEDQKFCGGRLHLVPLVDRGDVEEYVCSRCGATQSVSSGIVEPDRLYGGQATSKLVYGNALGTNHETRNPDGSSNIYALRGNNGKYGKDRDGNAKAVLCSVREWNFKGMEEPNSTIAGLKQSITSMALARVQIQDETREELLPEELEELVRCGRLSAKHNQRIIEPQKDEKISEDYGIIVSMAEKLQDDILHLRVPFDSHKRKNVLLARPGKRIYGMRFVREELKRVRSQRPIARD